MTEESVEISTPMGNLEEIETQSAKTQHGEKRPETISERRKRVREQLRTDHFNIEEKETLEQICNDYYDIFHLGDDSLSHTTGMQHEITTRG
ncbi:hypothetical protein P5V15_009323 [Pogonomyrmex californicus]